MSDKDYSRTTTAWISSVRKPDDVAKELIGIKDTINGPIFIGIREAQALATAYLALKAELEKALRINENCNKSAAVLEKVRRELFEDNERLKKELEERRKTMKELHELGFIKLGENENTKPLP